MNMLWNRTGKGVEGQATDECQIDIEPDGEGKHVQIVELCPVDDTFMGNGSLGMNTYSNSPSMVKMRSIFRSDSDDNMDLFDPNRILDRKFSQQDKLQESFRKYTHRLGNRFKGFGTELKFLNEHAILNRRTVYGGYIFQFVIEALVIITHVTLLNLYTRVCDGDAVSKEGCEELIHEDYDEAAMNIASGCFMAGMVIVGILSHMYIHRSKRITNKAWALFSAWLVYSLEMIGVSFIVVFMHKKDTFWAVRIFFAYTSLLLIAIGFTGLMFWQSFLLCIVTGAFYYGLSVPLSINGVNQVLRRVDSSPSHEDLLDYTVYIGVLPLTIIFSIIAMATSYTNERTARIRFLERLMITHQQNNVIRQKTKNEKMQRTFLENMLPAKIVDKLHVASFSKQSLEKLSQRHQGVAVLFADIAGFTGFATQVDSSTVMHFLNDLFWHFDELCDVHNVYKIETIGDCYVGAVGVVTGAVLSTDMDQEQLESSGMGDEYAQAAVSNATDMVKFAKGMIDISRSVMKPMVQTPALIRVGIHTGPCMSGIVGTRNMRYCLFGDTMNTAARMEQKGVVDAIHASNVVASLTPNEKWEPRGSIAIKGKGSMDTFLLNVY